MERRTFLIASAAALPVRAEDEIAVGLIGSGGRGRYVMTLMGKQPGVALTGVCDVYEPNLEAGLSAAGSRARQYRDYKRLLDNKQIKAVIIGTPEHWHAQMTIDAMAAGKDVYVEKPLCHSPEEGRRLVLAARESKSVVQVGVQRRSYDLYLKAREVVASGALGTVRMVRSWWLNTNLQSSRTPQFKGPIDWEQWQGPAKNRTPPDPARFSDWRSFSDYSGGLVADQGTHVFDGIHMLMGAGYPTAVTAAAGPVLRAGVDTPQTFIVNAEYGDDFLATFTLNYAAMRYKLVNDQLNSLDGDKARLDVGRQNYNLYKQGAEDTAAMSGSSGGMEKATLDHIQNFLECVRSRATPRAPIEIGLQATLVPQLASLSVRQGRRIKWNAKDYRVEM